MQPVTTTYALELAAGLAMIVAVTGGLVATTLRLLVASDRCEAKPSRNEALKSGVKWPDS